MREFTAYLKYGDTVWAYDRVSHTIIEEKNSVWTVRYVLPNTLYTFDSAKITVAEGKMCIWSHERKYIYICDLISDAISFYSIENIPSVDGKYYISNVAIGGAGIYILSFRGNIAFFCNTFDNTLKRSLEIEESLRDIDSHLSGDDIFVRAWGAPIVDNNLYFIKSDRRKDFLVGCDLEGHSLGILNTLSDYVCAWHLNSTDNHLWVQLSDKKGNFYIGKASKKADTLETVILPNETPRLHMQWIDNETCLVIGDKYFYIVDSQLNVTSLDRNEEMLRDLHYVSDRVLGRSGGEVYSVTMQNKDIELSGLNYSDTALYASSEYCERVREFVNRGVRTEKKQNGLDLETYIRALSS